MGALAARLVPVSLALSVAILVMVVGGSVAVPVVQATPLQTCVDSNPKFPCNIGGTVDLSNVIGGSLFQGSGTCGATSLVFDNTPLNPGETFNFSPTCFPSGSRPLTASASADFTADPGFLMDDFSATFTCEANGPSMSLTFSGFPGTLLLACPASTSLTQVTDHVTFTPLDSFVGTVTLNLSGTGIAGYSQMSFNVSVTPTPEPGTLMMIGPGLFALAALGRRRNGRFQCPPQS